MGRYREEFLDVNQPLYVRKAFKGNGRRFTQGALFNWQQLAIAQHRVEALFRSSYLTHQEPKQTRMTQFNTEGGTQDVEIYKGYKLIKRGGPYFDVEDGHGDIVNDRALYKKKAMLLVDEILEKEIANGSEDETALANTG